MGLTHILEARQRKDGMSEASASRFLYDIVARVAEGPELSPREVDRSTRVGIERGDAVVWLAQQAGNNA